MRSVVINLITVPDILLGTSDEGTKEPINQEHDEETDSQEGAHADLVPPLVPHLEDDRLDEVADDEREAVGDVAQLGA